MISYKTKQIRSLLRKILHSQVNFPLFHCTGRYELNKLTSLPMCGFIAQLVEHRTGIAEVTGSNPVEALIFFRLLLSNCLNWKIYCDDHISLSLILLQLGAMWLGRFQPCFPSLAIKPSHEKLWRNQFRSWTTIYFINFFMQSIRYL